MSEQGFWHPLRGYWVGSTDPKYSDAYPDGTVEVPPQPSVVHVWDGSAWVEDADLVAARDAALADPRKHDLSPAQFQWLLAFTGLDDVTDTVLAVTKGQPDKTQYANLKLNLARNSFIFETTMALVAEMAFAIPAGVDVSEAAIGTAWLLAKDQ